MRKCFHQPGRTNLPLTPPSPLLPILGKTKSTLCLSRFLCSGHCIQIESYSMWPFMFDFFPLSVMSTAWYFLEKLPGGSSVQSVLRTTGLEPWYSECGPWACNTASPGSLLEIWTPGGPEWLSWLSMRLLISAQVRILGSWG